MIEEPIDRGGVGRRADRRAHEPVALIGFNFDTGRLGADSFEELFLAPAARSRNRQRLIKRLIDVCGRLIVDLSETATADGRGVESQRRTFSGLKFDHEQKRIAGERAPLRRRHRSKTCDDIEETSHLRGRDGPCIGRGVLTRRNDQSPYLAVPLQPLNTTVGVSDLQRAHVRRREGEETRGGRRFGRRAS